MACRPTFHQGCGWKLTVIDDVGTCKRPFESAMLPMSANSIAGISNNIYYLTNHRIYATSGSRIGDQGSVLPMLYVEAQAGNGKHRFSAVAIIFRLEYRIFTADHLSRCSNRKFNCIISMQHFATAPTTSYVITANTEGNIVAKTCIGTGTLLPDGRLLESDELE